MALKAGYKGFKKLISPLKLFKPGELGIDQDALVEDLNSVFFPRSEQAVMGAVNALNTYVEALKKINTSGTWSGNDYTLDGVTFTVADDGKITANNQSTAIVYFNLDTNFDTAKYAGWKMNGLPSDGANNTFMFRISASTADRAGIQDFESSADTAIINNGSGKCLAIRIANGYNPSNKVFAPMVSISGGSYVPYAMTNDALTELAMAISKANDGVIQVGKLVVLNKVFTLTSNLASGWNEDRTDITFPKPIAYVPVLIYSGTSYYQGLLGTAGNNIKISSAVSSGETITICAAYIAEAIPANREANRAAVPEEVDPEEAPATRSTKKSTKSTASADNK